MPCQQSSSTLHDPLSDYSSGGVTDDPAEETGNGATPPANDAEGAGPSEAPEAEGGSTPPQADSTPPEDPLEAAKNEAGKLRDQLLRTAADFDNFRKRHRRELVDADRRGREELLKEMLPVFDNLERAVAHAETASDVASLGEGIRMVMRQFADTLGRLDIERVASVGEMFDPMLHEAIQQQASEEPPGTITAEVQAGYRLGDHLIRPAMVVVAKAPESTESAATEGADEPAEDDSPDDGDGVSADAEDPS